MADTNQSNSNLWLLLDVLARRRGLIIGLTLLAIVVSVIVSLLLPKWYEGTALLLPPKDTVVPISGQAELAELASVTGGLELPIMVTPADIYARMLASRSIMDRVISELELRTHYDASGLFEAREALKEHSSFRVTDEGLLEITVEDRDPETAAAIANAYVDELNDVNEQIVSSRARKNREFIEERLAAVETELDSARAALERFQRKYRALDFDEQTRLAINQATSLKIQLAELDIEIGLKEQQLGENNPQLQEVRRRRRAIKQQLDELEHGSADTSYFSLALDDIPQLRGAYQELAGRVQVAESIYNTLLSLLEQAKIQEQSVSAPLSVLDRAEVPEIRSRPQRSLIVAGSTVVVFILSILLAAWLEYLKRMRERRPEDYERLMHFAGAWFGWLPGVRKPARST